MVGEVKRASAQGRLAFVDVGHRHAQTRKVASQRP
jgi:hypothetical protein